jgi:AraC-like DNA-binding protein
LNVSDVFNSPYLRVAAPRPPLRPFVECFWIRAIAGADPRTDRRILPDGRMDLVWIPGLGVLVAGPQSRYTERPDRFPFLAIGARFHPGGAPSLLGVPASDFVDGHVPLGAIDHRLADRLDARLEGTRDHAEAFAAFNAELLQRLDGLAPADPTVQAGVRLLDNGSVTVGKLAAELFVSERQLRRRFAERVGYGPKTLQRIFRFQRFAAELRSGRFELAAAAAAAGYADQAHLSRESVRLAGLSPRELADWIGRGRQHIDYRRLS